MKISRWAIIAAVSGLILTSVFVSIAGDAIVNAQLAKKQNETFQFSQPKPESVMSKGLLYLILMPADDAEIIRQLWGKTFLLSTLVLGIGGGVFIHRKFSLELG